MGVSCDVCPRRDVCFRLTTDVTDHRIDGRHDRGRAVQPSNLSLSGQVSIGAKRRALSRTLPGPRWVWTVATSVVRWSPRLYFVSWVWVPQRSARAG